MVAYSSSFSLFVIVEDFSQFGDFLSRSVSRRQGADHKMLHRPVESTVKQVPGQLALHRLARLRRCVNMRSLALIAAQESFLRHDLHELQDRAVVGGAPAAAQCFVDFAGRTWPAAPKHSEDFKL